MYSYTPHRSTTFPAMTPARSNPEARSMLERQHRGMRATNVRHVGALPNGTPMYHGHMQPMGNPGGMPGLGALVGVMISRTVYMLPYWFIMAPFHKPGMTDTTATTVASNPDSLLPIGGDTAAPSAVVITPPKPTDPGSLTFEQASAMAEAQRKEVAAKYPIRPWAAGFLGVGMTALGAYYGARIGAAPEDRDLAGRYALIGGAGFSLLTMVGMALGAGRPEVSGGGAVAAAIGAYMAKGSSTVPTT